MIVIIPTTKDLDQRVLAGLSCHTIIAAPNVEGDTISQRRANMCAAVNGIEKPNGYWAKIDSDVELEPVDLDDCAAFLDAHPSFDAVAIDTKYNATTEDKMPHEWLWNHRAKKLVMSNRAARHMRKAGQIIDGLHICCAAVVFRNPYTFYADEKHCWCMGVNKDLKIRYIDARMRFELKERS